MSRILNIKGKSIVIPEEGDFKSAVSDGIWYPICPYCSTPSPAEPDADKVVCQNCERTIELSSIV